VSTRFQRSQFVAVQAGRVGFVVDAQTADVDGRGVIEEFFFDGVAVEPGDGRQAPGDGDPGPPAGLEVAGEAFDVGTPGTEQVDAVLMAPAGVLAQIQLIGLASQATVASEENRLMPAVQHY
jgi:hypothetical protein